MWIERIGKKTDFIQYVKSLRSQVLVVRGARQVGKTAFINNALEELPEFSKIRITLLNKGRSKIDGIDYFGRDFLGSTDDGAQLVQNINFTIGDIEKLAQPVIVFIDEADRLPAALEAIQTLAGLSEKIKIIYTGSNLENIHVKNAATGRKKFFDLYPITFQDFLNAQSKTDHLNYLNTISFSKNTFSEMYHNELLSLFDVYMRLGGMPRVVDVFLNSNSRAESISPTIADLVATIEENVKMVLGDKLQLYEYEDVLRRIASLSGETLKFSRLQVQHAGRSEAKKLVNKTVGARVAHKIRLFEPDSDLSKYILFDCGVLNYLLNGSELLGNKMTEKNLALQMETAVGCELISNLVSRDDLLYWKSSRGAQVEYLLKSPVFAAIDVKTTKGDIKSLDSCAIYEKNLDCIVKISKEPPMLKEDHCAKITALGLSRKIPLVTIPHYLTFRLLELMKNIPC